MEEDLRLRIKIVCERYSLTTIALADLLEVSQQQASAYLTGVTKIPIKFVCALLDNFSELSAEWLMRGNGDIVKPKGTSVVVKGNGNVGNGIGNSVSINSAIDDEGERKDTVPVITPEVSRQPDLNIYESWKDDELDLLHVPYVEQLGDYTMSYVVQNDAMSPMFIKGDRVAIKHLETAKVINGNIYVVDSDRGMFLRKASYKDGVYTFRSLNREDYADMELKESEIFSIFVVIGQLRILY